MNKNRTVIIKRANRFACTFYRRSTKKTYHNRTVSGVECWIDDVAYFFTVTRVTVGIRLTHDVLLFVT